MQPFVVSLEYAKKLKKAGWPQIYGSACWREAYPPYGVEFWDGGGYPLSRNEPLPEWCFAAPGAEEILNQLGERLEIYRLSGDRWRVHIMRHTGPVSPEEYSDTLADAAAAAWIREKESK